MSQFTYANILIDKCKVRLRRQTVLAGSNYLYTKFLIVVEGIYNPKLNNYVTNGPAFPFTPTRQDAFNPQAATSGPTTDVAVRLALMQPRKALLFTLGGVRVVSSPQPNYVTDAANGPTPLECNVTRIEGTKTFFVEFAIEAAINENNTFPKTTTNGDASGSFEMSLVLAHEWSMTHNVDPDFFTTRYIKGRVIFRSDLLQFYNLIPDQFREWLVHPVPFGFRRQQIQVTALPGGTTIEYLVVDKERALPYDPKIVTRVEASLRIGEHSPGLAAIMALTPNPAHAFILGGAATPGVWAGLRGIGERLGDWVAGMMGYDLSGAAPRTGLPGLDSLRVLPTKSYHMVVRMWGHRFVTNDSLRLQAFALIASRFPTVGPLARLFGGWDTVVSGDLSGKFVQIEKNIGSSIIGSIGDTVVDELRLLLDGPTPIFGGAVVADPGTNIKDNPARGNYLGACVAAALRDASTDVPPTPRDPDSISSPPASLFLPGSVTPPSIIRRARRP